MGIRTTKTETMMYLTLLSSQTDRIHVGSNEMATAAIVNTGTIAAEARFGAGFSPGNASERVEGSIRMGIKMRMNKSFQFRVRK